MEDELDPRTLRPSFISKSKFEILSKEEVVRKITSRRTSNIASNNNSPSLRKKIFSENKTKNSLLTQTETISP